MTGMPMVLIRLHGCPVGCPFCDTKETWGSAEDVEVKTIPQALGANNRFVKVNALTIAVNARWIAPNIKWIMLTGGEPALQPLGELVQALHEKQFKVALETSGTADGHIQSYVNWVCVSPKIDMPGGKPILPSAIASADEIKMVIGKTSDVDKLEDLLEKYPTKKDVSICLQPMSQSKRATELCMKLCLARGWRLSLQTHKLVNIK